MQSQVQNQKGFGYDYKYEDKKFFAGNQNNNNNFKETIVIDGESNKNYFQNNRANNNRVQEQRPVSPNRRSFERKNFRNDYFDQKYHFNKQENNRQNSNSQYNNNMRDRDKSYNNKGKDDYRKLNNNFNNKFQNNNQKYYQNQGYNNYANKFNYNNNGKQQENRYNRRLSSERGERRSLSRQRGEETPLRNRPKYEDQESNYSKKRSVSSSSRSRSSSRSFQKSSNRRSDDQSYYRRNSNQFSSSPQQRSSLSPQNRNRNESDSQGKMNIHSIQRSTEKQILNQQNRNKSMSLSQVSSKPIGNNNQLQQLKPFQQNKFIGQKINDGNGNNSPEKQGNNFRQNGNSPLRANQDKFQFQSSIRNKPQENVQFNYLMSSSQIKPSSQIVNPVIQQNGTQQFANSLRNTTEGQNEVKNVIQQQQQPFTPQIEQKFQNFPMFNTFGNVQPPPPPPLKGNSIFNPFCGSSNLLTKGLEKQQSNN